MKADTDYAKRELLIKAAKEEFMEKGYNKASLRNICAKAGVTTGALYFFFENKEDLYEEIVGGPRKELAELIKRHMEEDKESAKNVTIFDDMFLDHSEEADMFVECIYKNYDSFILMLTKGKEGELEKWTDYFVKLIEKTSTDMMMEIPAFKEDPFMTHWVSHTIVDSFIHVMLHESKEEEAKKQIRKILNFIVKGWASVVLNDK